jgi:hypothetical protein
MKRWLRSLRADSTKARKRRVEWYESELRWLEQEHERIAQLRDAELVEAKS